MDKLKNAIDSNESIQLINTCAQTVKIVYYRQDQGLTYELDSDPDQINILFHYKEYREYIFSKYLELIQDIHQVPLFNFICNELRSVYSDPDLALLFYNYVELVDKPRKFIDNLIQMNLINNIVYYMEFFQYYGDLFVPELQTIIDFILFKYKSIGYIKVLLLRTNEMYSKIKPFQFYLYIIERIYEKQDSSLFLENNLEINSIIQSALNAMNTPSNSIVHNHALIGMMKGNVDISIFKEYIKNYNNNNNNNNNTTCSQCGGLTTIKTNHFTDINTYIIQHYKDNLKLLPYIRQLYSQETICFGALYSIINLMFISFSDVNINLIELVKLLFEFKGTMHYNVTIIMDNLMNQISELSLLDQKEIINVLDYIFKQFQYTINGTSLYKYLKDLFSSELQLYLLNQLQCAEDIDKFIAQDEISNKYIYIFEEIIYLYLSKYPKISPLITPRIHVLLSTKYCMLSFNRNEIIVEDEHNIYIPLDLYIKRYNIYKRRCINHVIMHLLPVYELGKLIMG